MKALLVVDVQNDFLPGGALSVPGGDEIIPVINRLLGCFELVVASQDWHPPGHISFATSHPGRAPGDIVDLGDRCQRLWPTHCVQGSAGAEFAPGLDTSRFSAIVHKGVDPAVESYSAFFDEYRRRDTGLADFLREHGVGSLYIAGLATDYCVRATSIHARELGLDTHVIIDACRGIDVVPGDVARALVELRGLGVEIVRSAEIFGDAWLESRA